MAAKLILCGLESRPKLNGREVHLKKYHPARGRWEVELEGDFPMVDLFKIEWSNAWTERSADEERWAEKGPTFKEVLDKTIDKHNVTVSRKDITVVDCNFRPVSVFEDGSLPEELCGQTLPRKDTGWICQSSFPLTFQRTPDADGSLAVRPCCLRIREDDTVEKLRFRKVEMSVGALHAKPRLDGQFGELGYFQAASWNWAVRPDVSGLWDVKVDGKPCPVLLRSNQLKDEATGEELQDPVRFAEWDRNVEETAVCAARSFKAGEIILEDEPELAESRADRLNLMNLWTQFQNSSREVQAQILDMCKGPPTLNRLGLGDLSEPDFAATCSDFGSLPSKDRERAWNIFRTFDHNCFAHKDSNSRLLYVHLARLHHSCRPNALLADMPVDPESYAPGPFKKALIAQHDIEEGEEITICLLRRGDLLEPLQRRRELIINQLGFSCLCRRCSEDDDLLRTFSCTKEGCSGVFTATAQSCLKPCDVCGTAAPEDTKSLFELEELHDTMLRDFIKALSEENPITSPDHLVSIIENATYCGLSSSHYVVAKVREILSLFYEKNGRPALAAENVKSIIDLELRVLGVCSSQLCAERADELLENGELVEAFRCFSMALLAEKRRSPEHPVGRSAQCDDLRKKLRKCVEARASKK